MKKYLILLGVIAGLLTSGVASAKLVDYYYARGQNLPSVSERKTTASNCGILNYRGSASQNLALENCLSGDSRETLLGGLVTKPYTFSPNTVISSAQINSDFDTLYNLVNGNIDNDNIKSAAAISASKISGTAVVTSPSASQTITNAGATYSTIIKGVSGQTADIFSVQNTSSTNLLSVTTNGVDASTSLYFTTTSIKIYPNLSNGKLTFVDQTDGPYTLSQLAAVSAFGNGTAINIVSNTIYVLVSSTTGMATDTSNNLYQKIKTDTGLEYSAGSQGIHINTSTLVNTIASSTPTANQIPIWKSNSQLSVSSTPIASTDATSKGYVDALVTSTVNNIFSTSSLPSRSLDVVYQNTSTKTMVVIVTLTQTCTISGGACTGGAMQTNFLTGTSTPTNIVAEAYYADTGFTNGWVTVVYPVVTFFVAPNEYYEAKTISGNQTGIVNWREYTF